MTDISQPPRGTLERCLPAVFITQPSPPAHTHSHKVCAQTYAFTHTHSLLWQISPQSWLPILLSVEAFLSQIHNSSANIHIGPWLPPFPCYFRPLPLLLPLFMLCTPQGWTPPLRGAVLFEGCWEDRPRPCHQRTSSSPQLHSRTTLESKLRAFHKPTNTQTLAHAHTHSRLPAHLPAARGDQTGMRCLAQGHTQMDT